MQSDDRVRDVLRRHKRWADGYALIWFLLTMAVFGAAWFLLEESGVAPVERIPAFVLLSTVMLGICVWQAAGALAARIELSRDAR
jgi:hypothetical protein